MIIPVRRVSQNIVLEGFVPLSYLRLNRPYKLRMGTQTLTEVHAGIWNGDPLFIGEAPPESPETALKIMTRPIFLVGKVHGIDIYSNKNEERSWYKNDEPIPLKFQNYSNLIKQFEFTK